MDVGCGRVLVERTLVARSVVRRVHASSPGVIARYVGTRFSRVSWELWKLMFAGG